MIKNMVYETDIFLCQHLSSVNKEDLKDFSCDKKIAYNLQEYIKDKAFYEEADSLMRTYIVRSKEDNGIVAYFSLKAGLVSSDGVLFHEGNFENILNTYPGVEIANFSINSNYINTHKKYKGCGLLIFNSLIKPIIKQLAKYIGIKYIFIFALPKDSLIERYKKYEFQRLNRRDEDNLHNRIKPYYDKDCTFMYQKIFDS